MIYLKKETPFLSYAPWSSPRWFWTACCGLTLCSTSTRSCCDPGVAGMAEAVLTTTVAIAANDSAAIRPMITSVLVVLLNIATIKRIIIFYVSVEVS